MKNIVADPARFGLQLAEIPNEPYFATVTARRHIDVALAATLADVSLEEFRFLNPAHNKPVINANAAETIVLPRDKVATFRANLENHDQPLVSWQAYTVKPGEKPDKIAAKHGISVSELKQINGISGNPRLKSGQPLLVPVTAGAEPNLPDLPAPVLAANRTKKVRYVPASRRGVAATQRRVSVKKAGKAVPAKRIKASVRTKKASPSKASPKRTSVAANP